MHFETLGDFLAMGGYAGYVWSAYGITAFAIFSILFSNIHKRRQLLNEIKQTMAREERIEKAKTMENTL